jgi:hypothetical protein
MSTGFEWLLVATNAFFILPCIVSDERNRFTRSVVYFLMALASSFHHACIGGIGCVLAPTIARKTDFFFAQLLVPVTSLYLIEFPQRVAWVERWLIWTFMVALYGVEIFTNEPFWMEAIVVGTSILILVVYWIMYGIYEYQEGRGWRFPPYDWYNLTVGIWLSVLAIGLFGTQGHWPGGYDYIHSLWHTLAAFGQTWILLSRKPGDKNAVLDTQILAYTPLVQTNARRVKNKRF